MNVESMSVMPGLIGVDMEVLSDSGNQLGKC